MLGGRFTKKYDFCRGLLCFMSTSMLINLLGVSKESGSIWLRVQDLGVRALSPTKPQYLAA